jgi:tetratricopeptide repeat protein 8
MSLVFQGICDHNLAYQCFRLCLASNNDHAEAYNNLGVLELKRGHVEAVSVCFLYACFVSVFVC